KVKYIGYQLHNQASKHPIITNSGAFIGPSVFVAATNGIGKYEEQVKNLGCKVTEVAEPIKNLSKSVKDQAIKHPVITTVVVTAGVGALVGPVVFATAAKASGFTANGIAANSAAATFMSTYGGAVASGSACAVLQSVGAAGTGLATTVTSAVIGGVAGYTVNKAVIQSSNNVTRKANTIIKSLL
ncbi:4494_t:CDS:2, partial [Ambispora leptoticha]